MQHFVNNVERYIVNQIIHISWREFQDDLQNNVSSLLPYIYLFLSLFMCNNLICVHSLS